MEEFKNRREVSEAARRGDVESMVNILKRHNMDANFSRPMSPSSLFCPPPLLVACEEGNLEVVRALLKFEGIDVNHRLVNRTPLSDAATGGYVEIMKLLIDRGAHVNNLNRQLFNPLSCAVRNGHYEAAALLLEKGADPNYEDPARMSPLVIAANFGHSKLVKLLLDNGAIIEQNVRSPLIAACSHGHTACARVLIDHGANPNEQDGTPLINATSSHCIECMKLLLEKGADANQSGMSVAPLIIATRSDEPKEVELLLKYGANVNVMTDDQLTALYLACRYGLLQVAKVLLENGADVNQIPDKAIEVLLEVIHQKNSELACLMIQNRVKLSTEFRGKTPLLCTVRNNDMTVVEELVYHGAHVDEKALSCAIQSKKTTITSFLLEKADEDIVQKMNDDLVQAALDGDHDFTEAVLPHVCDINIQLKSGNTALMEAARCGKENHVKLLLKHSAQVNTQNANGETALMMASQGGHTKCTKLLLKQKDININLCQLKSGNTALMEAAKRGQEDHMKLFLEHSAQVNVQNENGGTALMMASQGGYTKCVEMLLKQKDINVNLQNNKECTALMLASENGHVSVVELLLGNNAKLEITNTRGCSALFYGVKSNSPAVVKMLLDRGADATQKTLDSKNTIQFAYECHKEPDPCIIKMLKKVMERVSISPEKENEPTLQEAYQLLFLLASDWHNIGALLGILGGDLKIIKANNDTVQSCLREMLTKWLSHVDPLPTWSSLATAVEKFDGKKAQEIRQKYCKKSPASKLKKQVHPEEFAAPQDDEGSSTPSAKKPKTESKEQPKYKFEEIDLKAHNPETNPNVNPPHPLIESVQLILLTCNENEKWAVYEKLKPPTIKGETLKQPLLLSGPKESVTVIGIFAGHPVAVLTTEQGNKSEPGLREALVDYFPNVITIIAVGMGYGRDQKSINFADVMVSDHIFDASQVTVDDASRTIKIKPRSSCTAVKTELLKCFKTMTKEWETESKFRVSREGRIAKAKVGTIMSREELIRSEDWKKKFMDLAPQAIGGEMEGSSLLSMVNDMEGKRRPLSVIVIKGVADYGDSQKNEDWQFTAAKAAADFVHYCLEKTGHSEIQNLQDDDVTIPGQLNHSQVVTPYPTGMNEQPLPHMEDVKNHSGISRKSPASRLEKHVHLKTSVTTQDDEELSTLPTKKPKKDSDPINEEQPMYNIEEFFQDHSDACEPKSNENVDPKPLIESVQLILLTCNENEKWAVYEKLQPPTRDLDIALNLHNNVVIGCFGGYTVGVLTTTRQGKKPEIELQKTLKFFPKAKAIIAVGVGYGKDRDSIKFGDVMVSDHIEDASQVSAVEDASGNKVVRRGSCTEVTDELLRHFGKTIEWQSKRKFKVSKQGRFAQAKVGVIVSSETLMRSESLKKQYMDLAPKAVGGEMEGCLLLNMIKWMNHETPPRPLSVIVIKGVADYGDNDKHKRWQFTAAKAAADFVHYCLEKTEGRAQFVPNSYSEQ